MTISEKIQFYRKNAGLSQEELAKTLLVSRQTISLWENGQTLPTIDNLVRLKEIFGISLDDMLCSENIPQIQSERERSPKPFDECYASISSAEKTKAIKRAIYFPRLALLGICVLLLSAGTLLFLSVGASGPWLFLFHLIALSPAAASVILLYDIVATVKKTDPIKESQVAVKVENSSVVFETVKDGNCVSLSRHSRDEITVRRVINGIISVSDGNTTAYLNEESLSEASALRPISKRLLNIRSLITIAALTAVLITSAAAVSLTDNNPIRKIERYAQIRLPEHVGMTEAESIGLINDCHVGYIAEIFYNDESASRIEKAILNDEKWQKISDVTDISVIIPDTSMSNGADFFLYREYKSDEHVLLLYFTDENILKAVFYSTPSTLN